MTKLTRKLMISVFTLAFALVTLGASTFAWFTLTSTASLDTVTLEVVTGEGIEISLDGQVYKNFFTLAEIKKAITGSESGTLPKLDSVTSSNGYSFERLDVNDNEMEVATTGFIQFKLWFRSPTENAIVYLDGNTKTSSGSGTSWTPDTTFEYRGATVTPAQPISIFAANALRFSFEEHVDGVVDGESNIFKNPKKFDSGEAEVRKPVVFELNAQDTGNIQNQRLDQKIKTDGLISYWVAKLGKNPANVLEEDPEKPGEFEEDPDNPGEFIVNDGIIALPPVLHNQNLNVDDGKIATLDNAGTSPDSNYYGFIMVRIWLEGWDPDNFDALLDKQLSITLSFSVAPAESED